MTGRLQESSGLSARQLCRRANLPYSSLLRWRGRARGGARLLREPGPRKTGPLPLEALRNEIEQLVHRPKRTAGTGNLYRRYNRAISRRSLDRLIAGHRQQTHRRRRRNIKHVQWKEPNLAWAIDATEYGCDSAGRKLYLIIARDLAAKYCFQSLVTIDPEGVKVAAHLRELFRRHGPPLLLKRDNGSLFNNQEIDTLLAAECVIPLNSPAYYPPYNGGIEKGIRELKELLTPCLPPNPRLWQPEAIAPFANAVIHLRNCRPRRSLAAHSAAEAYHHDARSGYSRTRRHKIFEWIKVRSNATIEKMDKPNHRSVRAAWRDAVETWLRCQGLIRLTVNGKVLPHLSLNLAS